VEVVASLSQGRTAAAQCGLFTYKSVPVIFEPPCMLHHISGIVTKRIAHATCADNAVFLFETILM